MRLLSVTIMLHVGLCPWNKIYSWTCYTLRMPKGIVFVLNQSIDDPMAQKLTLFGNTSKVVPHALSCACLVLLHSLSAPANGLDKD